MTSRVVLPLERPNFETTTLQRNGGVNDLVFSYFGVHQMREWLPKQKGVQAMAGHFR